MICQSWQSTAIHASPKDGETLTDHERQAHFARHVEEAYREMWRR